MLFPELQFWRWNRQLRKLKRGGRVGKQAQAKKPRVCHVCEKQFEVTAVELKAHARECAKAEKLKDRVKERAACANAQDASASQ